MGFMRSIKKVLESSMRWRAGGGREWDYFRVRVVCVCVCSMSGWRGDKRSGPTGDTLPDSDQLFTCKCKRRWTRKQLVAETGTLKWVGGGVITCKHHTCVELCTSQLHANDHEQCSEHPYTFSWTVDIIYIVLVYVWRSECSTEHYLIKSYY